MTLPFAQLRRFIHGDFLLNQCKSRQSYPVKGYLHLLLVKKMISPVLMATVFRWINDVMELRIVLIHQMKKIAKR